MTMMPQSNIVVSTDPDQPNKLRDGLRSLRKHPLNAALTVVVALLLLKAAWALLSWGVINAAWGDTASSCSAAAGQGACWAVIAAKARYILFGAYPFDEQWRPALAIALFVAAMISSCFSALWGRRLLVAWAIVIASFFVLLWGGLPSLRYVPADAWGGLPLTMALSIVGVLAAFPLGVGLALGRLSPIPSLRTACTVYIEVIRGVPLITVLFMSSVLLPLLLPNGMVVGGIARAMVAIVLFTAAYVAEVVRGGLQAVPKGQVEAAASLGLGYWKTTILILLPQALRIVIPPLVNTFIEVFKDTTLVIIVGLFDLLNTTRTAILEIEWRPYYAEAYLFAALVYFFFCFLMSRISLLLEHRMAKATRR